VTIEPLELGRDLADALAEKKGEDILLLDLTGVCTFADYFVLATGLSERTLNALADDLLRKFKGVGGGRRALSEGSAASGWILLDFGSVIVHLLSPAQRAFYRLEELWHEGHVILRIT
jgi:ribosome silencing factor RsfS/YbeB/iojap